MNNKKMRKSLIALGLVAIIGIGGTLAYFSQKTEEKKNVFTMGAGLSGELKEPAWDNIDFGGGSANNAEAQLGKTLATNFTPGLTIPKNPAVKNTTVVKEGKTADAWIALKLNYSLTNADNTTTATTFAALDKFINVTFDENWILSADKTTAYYKTPVAAGAKTSEIFSNVEIDKLGLTADQIKDNQYAASKYEGLKPADYEMKNFNIDVVGYLVQTTGFDNAEAAMKEAYPDVFK